jgi:hypothetical protein
LDHAEGIALAVGVRNASNLAAFGSSERWWADTFRSGFTRNTDEVSGAFVVVDARSLVNSLARALGWVSRLSISAVAACAGESSLANTSSVSAFGIFVGAGNGGALVVGLVAVWSRESFGANAESNVGSSVKDALGVDAGAWANEVSGGIGFANRVSASVSGISYITSALRSS